MIIRGYREEDIPAMTAIWNEVVEEGVAFPQEDFLTERTEAAFFGEQSYCGVAQQGESGEILGLYILHPNNVGRCGHICNASYAVASGSRGRHIGEKLVLDCIEQAGRIGFRVCSSMRWSRQISMRDICTRESGLRSLARSRAGFG